MIDHADEVQRRAGDLSALLRGATSVGVDLGDAISALGELVDRDLPRAETKILLLGEPATRRALHDVVMAGQVFSALRGDLACVTMLRFSETMAWSALRRDGTHDTFAARTRERESIFEKTIAEAEDDRAKHEAMVPKIEAQIAEAKRPVTKSPPPKKQKEAEKEALPPEKLHAVRAAWLWIVAFFARIFGRLPPALPAAPAPSAPPPAIVASPEEPPRDDDARSAHLSQLEKALAAARWSFESAATRIRNARAKHEQERDAAFVGDVRALVDPDGRGAELVELIVELPSKVLPVGVTLLDVPGLVSEDRHERESARAYLRDVDGCVVVVEGARAASQRVEDVVHEMHPVQPRKARKGAPAAELRRILERIVEERPLVLAARCFGVVRASLIRNSEKGARVEKMCSERIDTLEQQRIADATAFRAEAMSRMSKSIDEGVAEVVRAAIARLHPSFEAIGAQWKESIRACPTRDAVDACVKAINEGAQARLTKVVEDAGDGLVAHMQRLSDTLQIAVKEDLHGRFNVARRTTSGDGAVPVITEVAVEDFGELRAPPLAGAMDAFESTRVSIGIGGAAAGAVIGTLIVPGIGTAIGAFVGVLAGFLKTTDSLKQDCVAKLDACLSDAETQVRTQLETRRPDLATAIRSSLEEGIDASVQRFESALDRMLAVERRTLEKERAKREQLSRARKALEEHEARISELTRSAEGQG